MHVCTCFWRATVCTVNLPGQRDLDGGLRYYPVMWVFQRVNFVDFEFATRFPPHVSLAAVALKLSIAAVAEMTAKKEQQASQQTST